MLTRSRLDQVVPVVNAAMAERTMVEWDKDDLDALGILKIDVLALGMLTCVRKAFELLERHYGRKLDLASVPPEDPAVYDMLGRADSIGVFQVESRAQMTMLPRLRPRCFYDLVIEVAIVRPGPIQGDMVHPYLRRRSGLEPVAYPSAALQGVLEKTLGVPLFQEQAMQIAIVGAGFTPSEADRLRRAMATFKRVGTIHTFRDKFIDGMVANGYAREFAERCFQQIEGFGTYGFPEIPRRQLRAPGLRLLLAEVPLSGSVRLRAAQQPADGLLCAGPDRARCPRPRRHRAAGRRQSPATGTARWSRAFGPAPPPRSPSQAPGPPSSSLSSPSHTPVSPLVQSHPPPSPNPSAARKGPALGCLPRCPSRRRTPRSGDATISRDRRMRGVRRRPQRRSDSHHSPRHDPTVAADGKQRLLAQR